ncbi:MAG: hypothetical protein CMM35_05505 [Rhodospirillaceae bacterium]|nr:hypothetical protein [Rhodospirillaceae bacterium]
MKFDLRFCVAVRLQAKDTAQPDYSANVLLISWIVGQSSVGVGLQWRLVPKNLEVGKVRKRNVKIWKVRPGNLK